jgi:hypothetical protein
VQLVQQPLLLVQWSRLQSPLALWDLPHSPTTPLLLQKSLRVLLVPLQSHLDPLHLVRSFKRMGLVQ